MSRRNGSHLGERIKAFLMQHPVGREMLADAEFDENDVHWRKNLAYYRTLAKGGQVNSLQVLGIQPQMNAD